MGPVVPLPWNMDIPSEEAYIWLMARDEGVGLTNAANGAGRTKDGQRSADENREILADVRREETRDRHAERHADPDAATLDLLDHLKIVHRKLYSETDSSIPGKGSDHLSRGGTCKECGYFDVAVRCASKGTHIHRTTGPEPLPVLLTQELCCDSFELFTHGHQLFDHPAVSAALATSPHFLDDLEIETLPASLFLQDNIDDPLPPGVHPDLVAGLHIYALKGSGTSERHKRTLAVDVCLRHYATPKLEAGCGWTIADRTGAWGARWFDETVSRILYARIKTIVEGQHKMQKTGNGRKAPKLELLICKECAFVAVLSETGKVNHFCGSKQVQSKKMFHHYSTARSLLDLPYGLASRLWYAARVEDVEGLEELLCRWGAED